ncbi:hypothetical protein T484DRAFT_1867240 [Baffinella frigidus]|nr:hypothetical protein T484DRAFT_1867240 [Cryptophyta sp. CCMP2293]
MHWAAKNGHQKVVAQLLAAGATKKAEDKVVAQLLAAGATKKAEDEVFLPIPLTYLQ